MKNKLIYLLFNSGIGLLFLFNQTPNQESTQPNQDSNTLICLLVF